MSLLSHALETSRRSYSGRATRFLLVRARRFLHRTRTCTLLSSLYFDLSVSVTLCMCVRGKSDREYRWRIMGCECDEFFEDRPCPPPSSSSSSSAASSSTSSFPSLHLESLRSSVTRILCHRWDYPCSLFSALRTVYTISHRTHDESRYPFRNSFASCDR